MSLALAPAALAGLSVSAGSLDTVATVLVLLVLHVFVYPASNGFNSWFDRDTGSIGGVEHPPPVSGDLLKWSLALDVIGLALALVVGPAFAFAVLVYGLCSKAYSWDRTRLKRRPFVSWLGIGLIQGGLVCVASAACATAQPIRPPSTESWTMGLATTLLLLGSYPLTQIYQHDADRRRGDTTISMKCGVGGTFVLSTIMFAAATAVMLWHFSVQCGTPLRAALFVLCSLPPAAYLAAWAWRARRDPAVADYRHAMRMSIISATAMNAFFAWVLFA